MSLRSRFDALSLTVRLVLITIAVVLAVIIVLRAPSMFKALIFGDPAEKQAEGGKVVAEEQVNAAKETSIEAQNTVVRTYEHHVEIDHVVKGGQDAVAKADRGQQMDPAIDNAVAAGLCGVHDSLCRR